MTTDTLPARIRGLYDATTRGWVDVWGDHLHHGYYGPEGDDRKDHRQAQVDMVDAVLDWAGLPPDGRVERILDAGCGVGGSARHLATRLGAHVRGITLSPVQAELALTLSGGRTDVEFAVEDATRSSAPDGHYDLVWSLESGEHMPSKRAFLEECARVLRPGGRLVVATWCHRPVPPELAARERRRLDAISWSYGRTLTWVPLEEWEAGLRGLPFEQLRSADWSASVSPFWTAVLRSVVTPRGLRALLLGGRPMLTGAYGGFEMRAGLASGLVRYVVSSAVRTGHGERATHP